MDKIPSLEPPQGMDWLSQLPEDVLWTILGLLDLPALYTVRLVCKRFRKSAAMHFKSVDCPTLEELFKTDPTQFCGTKYLALTVSHKSHLQYLAHPGIARAVTHLSLKGLRWGSQSAGELEAVLMHLPRLRSVSVRPGRGDARLPLFPPKLVYLEITTWSNWHDARWANVGDASPLTRCSQLTHLTIGFRLGAGTLIGSLSSIRNLRSLALCSCPSALGHLTTFTALTGLSFKPKSSEGVGSIFQQLGRLTGLSLLVLSCWGTPRVVTHVDLTCIGQLTNLSRLAMSACAFADSVARSTALLPLTRLVSVRFMGVGRMPYLSRLQCEALHSLRLDNFPGALSVLQTATRLTHLVLVNSICVPMYDRLPERLCPAVARLSRLRSLCLAFSLDGEGLENSYLEAILRACTELTELEYRNGGLRPASDLKACAALPGLRSLSFDRVRQLTPAWLPALQAMSGLTELSLLDTGIHVADMTPDVIAAFDAERRRLGWPLLKLRVADGNGRRLERLERSTEIERTATWASWLLSLMYRVIRIVIGAASWTLGIHRS